MKGGNKQEVRVSIRSILVPVDGAHDNQAILENALELARTFNAHVDALHVRIDPRDSVPLFGEGLSGDMVEEMVTSADRESNAKADALRTLFEDLCKTRNVPQVAGPGGGEDAITATWREKVGREDEVVAWRGRLADLVVTARPDADASPMRALTLHATLFECGRPVLALPTDPKVAEIGRVVAIAWNGTAQAARAVHAAMPIITRAYEVNVLTCESERTQPTAADELAEYLGWWGVTPKVIGFPPGDQSIGQAILDQAYDVNADMLVTGAYSHSRLMQTVLGGVTSAMMDVAAIPVFFSH